MTESGLEIFREKLQRFKEQIIPLLPHTKQDIRVDLLQESLDSHLYTVVVLGEFKRGKSTFVNALIGEDLLPSDVTPTTAIIHAVMWDEQRGMEVHGQEGLIHRSPLTKDSLLSYTADGSNIDRQVDYLAIKMPLEWLKPNIVVVDTPGVSDLKQQRAAITYSFIPHADAVLFLLDATSPVRRTEQEFLQDTILKEGMKQIIFIANYTDLLDEEELPESLQETERRLAKFLGYQPKVFPLSARRALSAALDRDDVSLKASGLTAILEQLNEQLQEGSQLKSKQMRFIAALTRLFQNSIEEITFTLVARHQELGGLEEQISRIDSWFAAKEDKRHDLEAYITDRQTEILLMVQSSLEYLEQQMREELLDGILSYKGQDIKDYIENQIPLYVKRHLKGWVEQYTTSIQSLLFQLEQRISEGLSREFERLVNIQTDKFVTMNEDVSRLKLDVKDISNTSLIAGLMAGGAGALAMLLGAPVLLPLLGLAGFPMIQKKLLEQQLVEVKATLSAEFPVALHNVIRAFSEEVGRYVVTSVDAIHNDSMRRLEEQLDYLRQTFQEEKAQLHHQMKGIRVADEDLLRAKQNLIIWIKELL